MSCGCDDNSLFGLGNCGCDGGSLLSGLGGLGSLNGLDPMWSGDAFELGVRLSNWNEYWDTYLQFGNPLTNQNQYLQKWIADPMNESGWYYNARAYIYDAGVTSPYVVVTGNVNQNFDTDDEVKNDVLAYVQNVIGGISNIDYRQVDWKPTVHPNQQEDPTQKFEPSEDQKKTGSAPGTKAVGANAAEKGIDCARKGLVYNVQTDACECGTIDDWLVKAGIKSTCTESVFGLKSGAALVLLVVGGIFVIPPLLKKL